MVTVKEISDFIDSFAPYDTKCEWDNCGILVGDTEKEVKKIGFSLDLTKETFRDACEKGVDMIITHHPVIFKAQKSFLRGNMAFEAASNGITILSAHTCFDCAEGGINDVLCDVLGIKNPIGVPSAECSVPMVRMGGVEKQTSLEFAELVSKKLSTVCRVVDGNNEIRKVAVCGGAGADFIDDAIKMGADAYVTGDMSHHEFLDSADKGITVIAAGHFETENPAMTVLMKKVSYKFSEIETVILKQSNPVKFIG